MPHINFIALAVPFFLILIAVELAVSRARRRPLYRFADSIIDMACGVTQQTVLVFYGGFLVVAYDWLFEHHALIHFGAGVRSPWAWIVGFIGVDFLYYWWHRLSHEVNFLWAAHVVHHQSEDYNLAVALRQGFVTSVTIWPFYVPLAFLGIPPLIYVALQSFSTLYQFWIHTQLIGRLGPVDWVLNTPTHHRVHHAINPRYLDKNYGATLIVWDRLFGTYAPEEEPCVYGIVKPLDSFAPLWAQVHYWVELARVTWRAPRLADKVWVWFARPDWHARGLPAPPPAPEVSPSTFLKFDAPVSPRLMVYVTLHFALVVVALSTLMLLQNQLTLPQRAAIATAVLLSLGVWGALFERRRRAAEVRD